MPLLTNRRVLAAKVEATLGTAIALTSGTDGMINAYDVVPDADIPYNERRAAGAFGRLASIPGAYAGTLKFKLEAYGSGTPGTSPAWAEVLLKGCGMVESAGVWSPSSPVSTQHGVTLGIYEDGGIKKLCGAMGKWAFTGEDGKIGFFEFDFKGVWIPPTDGSMFTPQFSAVIPPRITGITMTVGAFTPTLSKVTCDYGNQVSMRQDATQASGYISALITDRKVTGTLDPETTLVATYDQFGIWLAGTTASLTCTIGSGGTGLSINAPVAQYTDIKEGNREGKVISNETWIAAQNGTTPDSELTITF